MLRIQAASRKVVPSIGIFFLLGSGATLFLTQQGAAEDKPSPKKVAPIVPPRKGN